MAINGTREINYFKIGAFFLIGITLILTMIIILSSGEIFKRTLYLETYFNESIQGLRVGSSVKYRGLEIGYVKKIAFVNEIYKNKAVKKSPYNRYIYVQMAITSSFLTHQPKDEASFAQQEINRGLRIQLAMQGLTGNAFAELNYVNPRFNKTLPIAWKPRDYYIPSTKSTMNKLSSNLQMILDDLKQVNFKSVFQNFKDFSEAANQTMQRTSQLLKKSDKKIASAISNIDQLSKRLNILLERDQDAPAQMLFGNPPPRLNPGNL